MKSYQDKFAELNANNEAALVAFTVLGYPDIETSIEVIKTLVEAGTDVLELGFPFSDPVADGPAIQHADNIALENGVTPDDCFAIIKKVREFTDVPIGLLIYANLVNAPGIENFYQTAADAGVTSILAADVPAEESDDFVAAAKKAGIDPVFLVSPLTYEERLEKIVENAGGFIYLVSRLGVTGTHSKPEMRAENLVKTVKSKTDLPVCMGFGISRPEHIKEVIASGADGAIVGSGVINLIRENCEDKTQMHAKLKEYISGLKAATKNN